MNNHIFLILGYIDKLMQIQRAQNWIEGARAVATKESAILALDRQHRTLMINKIKLHDEMFEISRSN